jgi:hypothetical protein
MTADEARAELERVRARLEEFKARGRTPETSRALLHLLIREQLLLAMLDEEKPPCPPSRPDS